MAQILKGLTYFRALPSESAAGDMLRHRVLAEYSSLWGAGTQETGLANLAASTGTFSGTSFISKVDRPSVQLTVQRKGTLSE
jgi:hypothetical protein